MKAKEGVTYATTAWLLSQERKESVAGLRQASCRIRKARERAWKRPGCASFGKKLPKVLASRIHVLASLVRSS